MPAIPTLNDISELASVALCPGELGFNDNGYFSPCFTNTYIFAPIATALALWAVAETRSLNTNGHAANTTSQRIKFLLTVIYVVAVVRFGSSVFNIISQAASTLTVLIVFVLTFLDLKGVNVPQKPLELYFFLAAAVFGYLTVQLISLKHYGPSLKAAIVLCSVSSVSGSARNIISAFDDAQTEAIKKTKKAE